MTEEQANVPPEPLQELLAYLQHLQTHVQPLTRSAAQLPGPSDLSFHRSLDKTLARNLEDTKKEVVETINALLACVLSSSETEKASVGAATTVDASKKLVSLDDLVEAGSFERKLGDVIDTLLERTDTRLDEFQGKVSVRTSTATGGSSAFNGRHAGADPVAGTAFGPLPAHILNAPIKPPPQQRFLRQPDNSREQSWQHSLANKPHALVPLTWLPASLQQSEGSSERSGVRQGMYCAEGDPRENPYYYEINNFAPPDHALVVPALESLEAPPPLREDDPSGGPIPFTWVDDEVTFNALYDHLLEGRVEEIAVDVEHHNYRSYQGLVCLVQISTRWQDFIVDALSPTVRELSHKLNEVFADPKKVKILHGAEHDILWLQRDLSVYVVGLFDTFHATNVLNFTQHGLAFLLHRYIDFVADKRYQLADWRIRPLPKEMLFYARSDTHSLIYVYDCLRFEIAQQFGPTGVRTVFEQSKRTASKTYAKEEWNDGVESREGWRSMWKRLGGAEAIGVDARWDSGAENGEADTAADYLTKTERLFRALHDWRDRTARMLDESPRYVLSSANLLNLASRAPDSRESVANCVGPALKKHSSGLLKVIESETKAFEAAQVRKEARQRELLERAASGQLSEGDKNRSEEIGEVVHRSAAANREPVHLWPSSSAAEAPSQTLSPVKAPPSKLSAASRLAKWLFAAPSSSESDVAQASVPPPRRTSMFMPISKAQSSQHLTQSIRKDLAQMVLGVLGGGQSTAIATENEAIDDEDPNEAGEGDSARQSATRVDAVESVETLSPPGHDEQRAANAEANDADATHDADDGFLQIRRKFKGRKRDKKRSSGDAEAERDGSGGDNGDTLSPQLKDGKKRKWTKEEKAERKRRQQESSTSANIAPFDYSTAVSVLDAGHLKPSTATPTKKTRDKGKDNGGSSSKPSKSKNTDDTKASRAQGRYANVPVGRDRREQAGGKSMTFSR